LWTDKIIQLTGYLAGLKKSYELIDESVSEFELSQKLSNSLDTMNFLVDKLLESADKTIKDVEG